MPVKQLKSTENELSCKLKHIEINHQTNANKDLIQKHGIHKERELTNTEDHQKIVNIWKIIWHINLNSLTEQQKHSPLEKLQKVAKSLLMSDGCWKIGGLTLEVHL